jgi:5-methylcytosine-specific restriction endonuclease McrA
MWKLPKPTITSRRAFRTCIRRVRDTALKARLDAVEDDVVAISDAFEAAATAARLHTLAAEDNVGGLVSSDEMSAVYTGRMAQKDGPGRAIYEELLAAPAHGRCPLCGYRIVSTLDHHMPKKRYPALAVTPANLVPACADCNKAKLETPSRSSEEATFHPYFDDIENDLWLQAEIIQTSPAALRFGVKPPCHWNPTTAARANYHFKLLNLSDLYASYAAEELISIRYGLAELHKRAGATAVHRHLADRETSCKHGRKNSWQTASYAAWAASNWFCAGGFA